MNTAPAIPARRRPPQLRAEGKGALQDRPSEHSEGQVEREPCREVRQERQDDHHLLAERVVTEGRSREPGVGRRQKPGADEDVEDREVHRLLAPEDLGVEGANAQKQEKSRGEHGFALKERAAVLAQEAQEIVPVAQERPGGGRGEDGQADEDRAPSVHDQPEGQAERQEVRDEDEAEEAREAEAPIRQTREGGERERHGEQPDEGEAEVPAERGAQRARGPGLGVRRGIRAFHDPPIGTDRRGHAAERPGQRSQSCIVGGISGMAASRRLRASAGEKAAVLRKSRTRGWS